MGRLRKGLWVFNDASGEYDSPGIDGRTIRHREVLVDSLNRALAGLPADRDAAERVGALIRNMNASTAEYLKAVDSWKQRGNPETNHISRLVVVLRSSHGSGGIRLAEINRSALLRDAIGLAQAAEAYRISRTRATGALKQDVAVPKTLLPPAPAGIENSLFTAAGIVH